MSLLIAAVIGGIILVMVASINDAGQTTTPITPTSTPFTSPLGGPASSAAPAGQSSGDTTVNSNAASSPASDCSSGCLLDNMCGDIQSIVARFDPEANTRYYYPPAHTGYQSFRSAETLGQTNYYFCTVAQAESQGWTRAP